MKNLMLFLFLPLLALGQIPMDYEPSADHPFGRLNPGAPKEVADFDPLIGICDCISTMRNKDQSWDESQKMIWKFSYIMNGMGVQDETLLENGMSAGSIRQFIADSSKWYVHYYSSRGPTTILPAWEGERKGDSIILYNEQKAPNGMDGFYRIAFRDINERGFNWLGEWVNTTETFSYPTWKIKCVKRTSETALESISRNTKAFSESYMKGDYEALANFYSEDGKIFPNKSDIISGREAIKQKWTLPDGVKILHHKVTPSEVKIIGDFAYDYGYYEGTTLTLEKNEISWKGKYVIVWKKTNDTWKIYLDIWNSI